MLKRRKDARERLKQATLSEYNDLIHRANLTPEQARILELHIKRGSSIGNIAVELFCCEATVRNRLVAAYDKLAKV